MITAEIQRNLDDLFMALLHANAKLAGFDLHNPNPYKKPSPKEWRDINNATMEQYDKVAKPITDALMTSTSPPPIIIKAGDWEGIIELEDGSKKTIGGANG